MYALALHTTSPQLGLAISNFSQDARLQTWDLGRDLSTHLHLCLDEFLHPQSWSDLSFIAVAQGPGSFTSTRIGVVTARTLAQQLGLPLFSVSTLEAIAWVAQAHSVNTNTNLAIQMAAQRQEVFGAIYASSLQTETHLLQTLIPDTALPLKVWQEKLAGWPNPYHLIQAENNLGNTAQAVLEIAYKRWQLGERPSWKTALPFYGQHPVT